MENMKIDPLQLVDVNLDGVAGLLKPIVFMEGDSYCTLLGKNPVEGVFGCGSTVQDSLADWEDSLKLHLEEAKDGDVVAVYVQQVIANNPPSHVKEFMEQFRPYTNRDHK